jgi:hypothetical protein
MTFVVRFLAVAASVGLVLLIYSAAIRPWFMGLGATPEEIAAADTTDRLVAPSAEVGSTRAVTIHAPAPVVWAWLAQAGQGRGGFYSYDILENGLFQCDIHSVDKILPQFQQPHTGDEFHFCSQGPPMTRTRLYVEPGRAIAFAPGWAFLLKPLSATETRLIGRWRGPRGPHLGPVGDFVAWSVMYDTAHFAMEQKMMDGIKRRAEGLPPIAPLYDDIQVLLWTIAFVVTLIATIAAFFGQRMWPQLAVAWAGVAVWLFLMLEQPSIAYGVPLVVALVAGTVAVLRTLGSPS